MAFAAQMICSDRGADRLEVELETTLRDSGASPVDVEIDDISVSGFRMQSTVDLRTGELVTVGLPGLGMQPAIVVRRAPGRYGCSFVNPVSKSYLERLHSGTPETVARFPGTAFPGPASPGTAFAGPASPGTAFADTSHLMQTTYAPHATLDDRFPLGTRIAIILALGIAFWVLVIAVTALIV